MFAVAGTLLTVAGNASAGTAGATAVGSTLVEKGDAVGVGTGAAELTPRLVISVESSGMPTGLLPELVDDDVDIGVEDALTLVEPEPHIPDMPDVSMMPDAVAIPELCSMPDVVDSVEVAETEAEPGVPVAVVPDMAPVAGIAAATPPPSKAAVDPNIVLGAVPTVEQITPPLGMVIVPVGSEGRGLTPGEAISVEPSGIPVWEMGAPMLPSGVVALIEGVGAAIPVTWAKAAFTANNEVNAAAINESFTALSCCRMVAG